MSYCSTSRMGWYHWVFSPAVTGIFISVESAFSSVSLLTFILRVAMISSSVVFMAL